MSYDIGKAMEGLEIQLWRRWSDGKLGEWAELNLIIVHVGHGMETTLDTAR